MLIISNTKTHNKPKQAAVQHRKLTGKVEKTPQDLFDGEGQKEPKEHVEEPKDPQHQHPDQVDSGEVKEDQEGSSCYSCPSPGRTCSQPHPQHRGSRSQQKQQLGKP